MARKLRSTGILFGAVFMTGFALNFVFVIARGDKAVHAAFNATQLCLLASSGFFLLSAYFEKLRWIQATLFIGLSPVSIISDAENIYGLGFFLMGVVLLERGGFFLSRRTAKASILLLYLFAIEIVAVVVSKRPLQHAVSPTFFIASFCIFLWFLYRHRLVVILKESKDSLSLTERGLSPAERSYVLEAIQGKQHKEIASEFELAESTVRNTLSRAYRKLGVEDRTGLATLAERYRIIE